jgi:hypothetical protein
MRKLAVVLMFVSAAAYADTEVSYGTPVVKGSYDAKAIETASASTKTSLLACADKTKLAAKTTAQVTLTITETGKLATSATGTQNAELDNCVAVAFATLAFAKPKDGKQAQAVVPVTFTPMVPKDVVTPADVTTPTIGMGTLGTGQSRGGSGYGVGSDAPRSRNAKLPNVKIGEPKVKGELDKAIIRRYIKRNIQKLMYCYEKELLAKPKLKGTITATFVIGADGTVTSAKATGLKDAAVEECYGRVIQMIAFPKPKTGEVTVAYPFTLKPD